MMPLKNHHHHHHERRRWKNFVLFCHLTTFLIVVLSQGVHCLYEHQLPPLFDESQLLVYQKPRQEQVGVELVENLGQIMRLDTLLAPKRSGSIATKFSIYNRRNNNNSSFPNLESENIPFQPQQFCFPNTCHGPYQYNLDAINSSKFNSSLRTIIMISGFLTKDRVKWMERTKDLWLELEDVNVILVTWKDLNRYTYSGAVANTPLVARQITIFLHYLAELHATHINDEQFVKRIHFIGHSLGSHIAGFVGQDLGGKMGRITGLDPAGPSFDMMSKDQKLDKSDALLVDAFHTNAGRMRYLNAFAGAAAQAADRLIDVIPLIGPLANSLGDDYSGEGDTAWYGIDQQVGHLDYYANNGRVQPGCAGLLHTCDHGRSHDIYEDILKHEIQLRRFTSTKQWLGQNRLLAFPADNYDSFLTGNSFELTCPLLLEAPKSDQKSKLALGKSFSSCTIPIDLLTPVDELKQELALRYGINFNNSVSEKNSPKYYFKTHSTKPLVGDHSLLKIRLDSRMHSWDSSCALTAKLKFAYGITTTIELNKASLQLIESEPFFGLAMPFVNPRGAEARNGLDNILIGSFTKIDGQLRGTIVDSVLKVLPAQVELTISVAEATGILELAKSKIIQLLKFGGGRQVSSRCHLGVQTIEVQPVVGFTRNVYGLYGIRLITSTAAGGDKSIRVLTPDEEQLLIKEAQIKNDRLPPAEEENKKLSVKNPSLTANLDALVIG